ncbi:hypothetical protein [Enterococcus alishanensis]
MIKIKKITLISMLILFLNLFVNIEKTYAANVTKQVDIGITTIDLKDSTGYKYPAGTAVSRNGGSDFSVYLSLSPYMDFGYGNVPNEYVRINETRKFTLTSSNNVVVTSSYLTDVGKYETLVPYNSSENSKVKSMYRLYNPNSGEHFYTNSVIERNNLENSGWSYEGIGWQAPTSGINVYRVYNVNSGDHHYTTSTSERESLIKAGWKDEGTGWYSDINSSVPLYRSYNPNARTGTHNYTSSLSEQNSLIKIGWRDEGIGWYGIQ